MEKSALTFLDRLQAAFRQLQRIDWAVVWVTLLVMCITGGVLLWGNPGKPRVRDFSWADRRVTHQDQAFSLTFTRPMDRDSVVENLQIDPPLPGRISWAGRRMAYTLNFPAPYGLEYTVRLAGAKDSGGQIWSDAPAKSQNSARIQSLQPFEAKFRTADRAIAYIGTTPEEAGRLVLYNFTRDEKVILTPADLSVMEYFVYPQGDRILFSALDRNSGSKRRLDVQLYSVTTGLDETPAAQLNKIIDDTDYQNLQFALAPDGKSIVIQRADRKNPGGNFGLWIVREGEAPQPLQSEPGGMFVIAPSGKELAVAQGQGIAVLPLEPGEKASQPIAFFPQFGRVFDFTADGQTAVMLKFNTDYTRSLFLVSNFGEPEEILKVEGSVLDVQFSPNGQMLYCLLTDVLQGETYVEQPYLAVLDLQKATLQELVRFEDNQLDLQFSLSPDNQAIVFDRLKTQPPSDPNSDRPRTTSGEEIIGGQLWLVLPLIDEQGQLTNPSLEELPLSGIRPRWLP